MTEEKLNEGIPLNTRDVVCRLVDGTERFGWVFDDRQWFLYPEGHEGEPGALFDEPVKQSEVAGWREITDDEFKKFPELSKDE